MGGGRGEGGKRSRRGCPQRNRDIERWASAQQKGAIPEATLKAGSYERCVERMLQQI